MDRKKIPGKIVLSLFLTILTGAGIYFIQNSRADEAISEGHQGPMPVNVVRVTAEPVQIWNAYSARLEAVDFAEIRPQVSGMISEVKFEDGQAVEEGDLLYMIDTRPYQAAVDQAKADLNGAKNQSALTWKELKRAKELIKTDAISKRVLDERSSAHSIASAAVKSAQARLDRAEIDLEYAHVQAPISGRASQVEVKKGNLVQAGPGAPLLTTIVSTGGIYADFEVDEQSYLKYIRGKVAENKEDKRVPVRLILSDGVTELEGYVHSFDNRLNVATGTIRARALFENEDGALLPGMFASVKMGTPAQKNKITIPEKAIGTDQNRKYVYIVNDQNAVEYREVKLGEMLKAKRVISGGLEEGDLVITEGIIRLRPGMPVSPEEDNGHSDPSEKP